MIETALFDFFTKADEDAVATAEANRVSEHRKMFKVCWPDWDGPKVDPESIDGYCQVDSCIVHSITHNENRYHYMAPCRIISISEDGETFEVEIEYNEGSSCEHLNGERLRLNIMEVWPPVALLIALRNAHE